MAILLNQLKQTKIRKEFDFEGEHIVINNPTTEQKETISKKLESYMTIDGNDMKIAVNDTETIRFLFNELVDGISFGVLTDEEMIEILNEPNQLLEDIIFELSDIVKEFGRTKMKELLNQIESMDSMIQQQEMIDNLNRIAKRNKKKVTIPNIVIDDNEKPQPISKSKPKSSRVKKVEKVEENA